MTQFRYYADTETGECLLFDPAEISHDPPGLPRGTYGRRSADSRWDATAARWVHHWHRITRTVRYASSPSRHVCNAKCQTARSQICECSCNGRNHGRFGTTRPPPQPTAPTLFACL